MQVKKLWEKNPVNFFVEHFKPHQAGWGSPTPLNGHKLESLSGTCIHMLLWKMQTASRKFIPVLAVQLCKIATLLKQAGFLALLIRSTKDNTVQVQAQSVFNSITMTFWGKLVRGKTQQLLAKNLSCFQQILLLRNVFPEKRKRNLIRLHNFYSKSCYSALRRVLQHRWDWECALVGKSPENIVSGQLECVRNFKARAVDEVCDKKREVTCGPIQNHYGWKERC